MTTTQEIYSFAYPAKNESVRKRLGTHFGFYWKTETSEARAILRANVALMDAGFSLEDFKKPVRINFPVENDLPDEGVFDIAFCSNRELGGEDGKTLIIIPGTNSVVLSGDKKESVTDNTTTDEGDKNKPDAPQLTSVPTMPLQHRILAQYVGNGEYLYHVDAEQKAEILRLEMDTENAYVQNMITAAKNVAAFEKAAEIDIHRAVKAYKTVFPTDKKAPDIPVAKRFLENFFATEYIDRGLLVKEWQEKAVQINQSRSGAELRHQHKQAWKSLDLKIAIAFLPGDVTPGNVEGNVLRWAKEKVIEKDREDWKRFSIALRTTDNILEYDDQTIFQLVRMRPLDIHKDPLALKNYITEFLATYAQPDSSQPEVAGEQPQTGSVNEEGKSDDEEKPQPSGAVTNEPAAPETVEPDTTEHHQAPQPLDAQPQVNAVDAAYQEKLAELHEARENIPPKNPIDVGKQLAAARGEYIEGISDPNDQKWIPGIQIRDTANQSEPETEQIEPESQQNEPGQESHDEMPNEVQKIPQAPETVRDESSTGLHADSGCDETGEAANSVVLITGNKINLTTSRMWHHLMIDIETMGTNCNAPVVAIAAIFFDPQTGEIGAVFYKVISLVDAMKSGATPDAETIEWWLKQSSEARTAILVDQIPLDDALLQLREFIDENSDEKFVKVWGNGATFDNVILRQSYERLGIPCPWRYYNDCDVRTITGLVETIGFNARAAVPFEGVRHNALDDARHQAKYLTVALQKLIPNQADF